MDPDQTQQTNAATAAAPQGIDPDLIRQAVVDGFRQMATPPAKTVENMSPEERAEYLEIFDPNKDNFVDTFTKAFNEAETPAERAKVLATFRDGVVNQSLRGAELMLEERMQQFSQQFAPARQFAVEHQKEAVWTQFQTKHPELKDQRELIDAVATQLSAAGFKPTNPDEAFSKIAETAKNILGKSGVQFPAANTNGGPRPAMAQMSSRSATGGNTTTSPEGQRIAKFWPSRKR